MRRVWTGLALAAVGVAGLAGCSRNSADVTDAGDAARSFEIRGVTDAMSVAHMPAGAECGAVPLPSVNAGWICDDATQMAYLAQPAAVVATDVKAVETYKSMMTGSEEWNVGVMLTTSGAEALRLASETASQKPLPVDVLLIVVNGVVVSAPYIPAPLDGSHVLLNADTEAKARSLVAAIDGSGST